MSEPKVTKAKARDISESLRLAIYAVDRCRELLINADADADDLAEYDAAAQGLKFTLEDCLALSSPAYSPAPDNPAEATPEQGIEP